MRLTKQQIHAISQIVSRFAGTGAMVNLFGFRLNDQVKSMSIALPIKFDTPLSLIYREQIRMELESQSGLPVDIIPKTRGACATPFQIIAQSHLAQLEV